MNSAGIAFAYEEPGGESLRIERGDSYRIASHNRPRIRAFVNAALEFEAAAGVRLVLLDSDPRTLDAAGRAALRARIGFMPGDGGLISNLNGWENAVLPLGYHHPQRLPGIAPRLLSLIEALGADPRVLLAALPEDMSALERKTVGFARALLLAPELMVAADFARGIDSTERPRIAAFVAAYNDACPGGTLLQIDLLDSE